MNYSIENFLSEEELEKKVEEKLQKTKDNSEKRIAQMEKLCIDINIAQTKETSETIVSQETLLTSSQILTDEMSIEEARELVKNKIEEETKRQETIEKESSFTRRRSR